jgi:hypothetical protein
MLIECPRCHARATLPEDKEGSKVRCGECARVFLARSVLEKGERQQGVPTSVLVIGITLCVALLGFLVIRARRSPSAPAPAPEVVAAAPAEIDPAELLVDWNAPSVQAAVRLHEESFTRNEVALRSLLHGPRLLERERAQEATEGTEGDPESAPESANRAPEAKSFAELGALERADVFARAVDDLVRGPGRELVADWRPFDGSVIETTDTDAVVRLSATPRDGASIEKRTIEWRLAREDGKWKAWSWERYVSPEEALREKRQVESKAFQKVTLSDGSVVHERDPEPLPHLDDTPPELRARIDELYATMTNLDLTKESSRALAELIEIGRPAIPILLTGLYQTPLDSEANARRVNLIDQALRSITGYDTGYKPQIQEASGVGTTEERQKSSVRQWFAWWYKNKGTFVEAEKKDALEDMIELTEEEKRWLEQHPD